MRALVTEALRITSPEMAMASQSDWESANKARRVFAEACSPTTVSRMLDTIERQAAELTAYSLGWTCYDEDGTWREDGDNGAKFVCLDENLVSHIASLSSGTPQ